MVCLTPNEISDYLQGRVPEDESNVIEDHLSDCRRCEELARQFDQSGDSLIRHLRLTPDSSGDQGSEGGEDWKECLQSLRELPQRTAESAPPGDAVSLVKTLRPESVYHYQLEEQLGHGGMGVVYRSWHPQLHRPVAIKILSASRAADAPSIARFQREMRAAGSLDHPGIVRAVDAGVWQGTYYLVMELIDGVDLSKLSRVSGPLTSPDACAIIVEAAEALGYAHDQQVIHRDIKPSNLILTREGGVKILDFGLARLEHGGLSNHDATTAGRLVGTLDYLAPEQAAGSDQIDRRADVYGLGATLFRLLAGQPPHGSSHNRPILQHLQQLTRDDPAPIDRYRKDLAAELCDVISRMLARDPDQRPQSAGDVATLLSPFSADADLARLATEMVDRVPSDDNANSFSASVLGDSQVDAGEKRDGATPQVQSTRPPRWPWIVAVASLILAPLGGFAAVTLWLKTGDAEVQIESEVDDITLQLVQDGSVAKEIEVHSGEEATIVRVGRYELKIAGGNDHVRLDQQSLLLMRGDKRIVRITQSPALPRVAVADELSNWPIPHRVKTKDVEMDADAGAPTSQGRTYDEWTSIILRERDPETVASAVNALQELGTPETSKQTFATLVKVAAWNESRGSDVICDDYIDVLHKQAIDENFAWRWAYKTLQDQSWGSVVVAITKAIMEIPEKEFDELAKQTIQSDDDAGKRILLATVARYMGPLNQRNGIKLVEQLCSENHSPMVRALAVNLWFDHFDQPASETHKNALLTGSLPLSKAVLVSLLDRQEFPFPKEQGNAAARLIQNECPGIEQYLHETVRALSRAQLGVGDLDAEAVKERRELLDSVAENTIPIWDGTPPESLLKGSELIGVMGNANLLDSLMQQKVAEYLQTRLDHQLKSRDAMAETSRLEIVDAWVYRTLQLLVSTTGDLPVDLEPLRIKEGSETENLFLQWQEEYKRRGGGDPPPESDFWLTQFPISTAEFLIKYVGPDLSEGREALAMGFGGGSRRPQVSLGILQHLPLTILVPYAARHLDDSDTMRVLSTLILRNPSPDLANVRLMLPIERLKGSLFKLAERMPHSGARGYTLRLAQIGGADDGEVQRLAMKLAQEKRERVSHRTGKSEQVWATTTTEFSWLLECLADAKESIVTPEQAFTLNERMKEITEYRRNLDDQVRCFSAILSLNSRVGPESDPEFRVLRIVLGERFPKTQIHWDSRGGIDDTNRDWKVIAAGVPMGLLQDTLNLIITNPPKSELVLNQLMEKKNRAKNLPIDMSRPLRLLNQAIAAVEKALAGQE